MEQLYPSRLVHMFGATNWVDANLSLPNGLPYQCLVIHRIMFGISKSGHASKSLEEHFSNRVANDFAIIEWEWIRSVQVYLRIKPKSSLIKQSETPMGSYMLWVQSNDC